MSLSMKVAAGVDVGGTNIVCGLLDEHGHVIIKRKYATAQGVEPHVLLEGIAAMIKQLCGEAGIAVEQLEVVGVGIPGLVDPEQGISLRAVNLQWEQVPVASILQQLLGKPVYIDNDVRMYVYGEAVAGAGRDYNYVYGITIGTGLAAALVEQGQVYYGHRYIAGEIGHVPVQPADFMCNCGRMGCLETIVSATGIVRQVRQRLERGEASILRDWFSDIEDIRASDISRACHAGDQLALGVMEQTGRVLGRALAWVVPILSPDVIVIGGGGALAGDLIFEPMKQELDAMLLQDYRNHYVIKSAELNDDAGLIGSALWALHRNQSIHL